MARFVDVKVGDKVIIIGRHTKSETEVKSVGKVSFKTLSGTTYKISTGDVWGRVGYGASAFPARTCL